MTPSKFDQRLADLEAKTRPADPRPDEMETRRWLQELAADAEALALYNNALVQTAKLVCPHQRHGWCRRCVEGSASAQAAWRAYHARLRELESNNVGAGQ